MNDQTVTAAMIVIGDEVLSGRTRDANTQTLAQQIGEIGIQLRESRAIADDHDTIIATVRELSARYDYVFTSGGIGPTHDDITAEAVAAAFDAPISIRDDARAILDAYYGDRINEGRLRMARIPDGASLISNPVSAAPGFRIKNVFVMAGVPKIFNAMLEGVCPTLKGGAKMHDVSIIAPYPESMLSAPLGALAEQYPEVSIGSYPRMHPDGTFSVTLVARSTDREKLSQVEADINAMLARMG